MEGIVPVRDNTKRGKGLGLIDTLRLLVKNSMGSVPKGFLIGPPAGGTVDWASSGWTYLWGHGPHDVYTYELAVRFSKVKDYYSVQPSW